MGLRANALSSALTHLSLIYKGRGTRETGLGLLNLIQSGLIQISAAGGLREGVEGRWLTLPPLKVTYLPGSAEPLVRSSWAHLAFGADGSFVQDIGIPGCPL